MQKYRRRMSKEEDIVQQSIIGYLRARRFLYTSTGAGLITSLPLRMRMNSLGYTAGSPDIIVWIPNGTVCIEVKRPPTYKMSLKTGNRIQFHKKGEQSEFQKIFEQRINEIAGQHYIVAYDVYDVEQYFIANGIEPK